MDVRDQKGFKIVQRKEIAELIGYESRNKYEITTLSDEACGFAAESGKSLGATIARQFLGHWRKFEIQFYDSQRQPAFLAIRPFTWFLMRLEVKDSSGRAIGTLQERFSLLTKKFVLQSPENCLRVSSPIWKPWTFEFKTSRSKVAATIKKKWNRLLTEAFLDADRFELHFDDPSLPEDCKKTLLAAAIFVDLKYFEKKA